MCYRFFHLLSTHVLFRRTLPTTARVIPIPSSSLVLPYRRNGKITTAATTFSQKHIRIMAAELSKEDMGEVERLNEPAVETEAEILGENKERDDAVIEEGKGKEIEEEVKKAVEDGKEENKTEEKEEQLPKLSASEFTIYNSMAVNMEYFHNHFRQSWTLLYKACEQNRRPQNMTLKQFISTGIQLCHHLSAHHSIEEAHIFPHLATRMPEFKQGKNAAELLRQHKEIHKGMDGFEEYLEGCRKGEWELELRVLKEKMDFWADVLWRHLEQEVETLGAGNMRRYWSVEEMGRMPM